MANIRRLMAEARRLEESGDPQAAIAVHRQALDLQEETTGFADLSLYNGLGDLYLRAGEHGKAVAAFEEAAQHCEDQQLYSNGIAVCKKILRNAPDHVSAYRREGRLLALSGLEAQAQTSYRAYVEHMRGQGQRSEVIDALSEFVDLTGDDATVLELVDLLIEADRGLEALTRLRAARDKRHQQGRDVVALVRRIQELQPKYGTPAEQPAPHRSTPAPSDAERPVTRTAAEVSTGLRDPAGTGRPIPSSAPAPRPEEPVQGPQGETPGRQPESPHPREADSDVVNLMRELQDVLSRTQGEERFRHALPIVEHLLEFEPGRFELLHRKLGYAYALGEEEAAIAAYLALGECLDRHLTSFSIRTLSTSTPAGDVKTAIKVEDRTEVVPTS